MRGNEGTVANEVARRQWNGLLQVLTERIGARVEQIEPEPGLPDMVFTANGGLAQGNTCVPARMRPVERQGEEHLFQEWFARHGLQLAALPPGVTFEGAGDALFGEDD